MFTPKGPICQSCSMPLSRDPHKGGTQSDGSLSTEYCSYCYKEGAFLQPAISCDEMKNLVEDKLAQMWIPRFIGRMMTKNIHQLKRWSE